MSKTIEIKGGIYFDADHNSWTPMYKWFGGELEKFASYLPVMEHKLTFTLPDDFEPQSAEIAALEAMRDEAQKKFTEQVKTINERIQKLLAITNSAEAA